MYEHTDSGDSGSWRDEPGSLVCSCPDLHPVHASCTPSPLPDAGSLPPRLKSGLTGSLSLHDYRKYLSQEYVDDPVDRSDKTLRRKTATSNLNRPPPISSALTSCAVSVSSAASSPPPLSPSYSHSVISQWSEQEPESLEIPGSYLHSDHFHFKKKIKIKKKQSTDTIAAPSQSSRDYLVSEHLIRPRPNRKRLVSGLKH